jgi:hypothetical protein
MEIELHKTGDGYQVKLLGDNGVSVGDPTDTHARKSEAKSAAKELQKVLEGVGAAVLVTDYTAQDDEDESSETQ